MKEISITLLLMLALCEIAFGNEMREGMRRDHEHVIADPPGRAGDRAEAHAGEDV